MDLICPNCQKRLTIEDRHAGMVVKCPMCAGMLKAPVLLNHLEATAPPTPSPLPPTNEPAPGMSRPPVAPAPATMPDLLLSPAPLPVSSVAPVTPPSPVVLDVAEPISAPSPAAPSTRPGEYHRSFRFHLRADVLEWLPPGCVVAIFLLSFFAWYVREDHWLNLWELAFSARGHSVYTFYVVVLLFLGLPAAVITCCLEKGWIPMLPALHSVWPYRALIVGGLVGTPFLLFLGDYVNFQFLPFGVQSSIAMKLAFRIHLVAAIATALQFWLELRKSAGAPPPRITLRW